jgi:alkaline phosphatase
MLEKSGRVQVVFQGHSHENDRSDINGITYLTMAAVIEKPDPDGGAHSVVEIGRGRITVSGFLRQAPYELAR